MLCMPWSGFLIIKTWMNVRNIINSSSTFTLIVFFCIAVDVVGREKIKDKVKEVMPAQQYILSKEKCGIF